MTSKALISDLTWRTLDEQREAFPDMPTFIGPEEIPMMLRKTTRTVGQDIHVVSLAVIAENEKDFRAFLALAMRRAVIIHEVETGECFTPGFDRTDEIVESWRRARREGAAKKGGEATAEKSEDRFWQGWEKIKDRWHLPAKKPNTSALLLEEANTTRNTVKAYLGHTRLEWQALTDAARERILKRKANARKS